MHHDRRDSHQHDMTTTTAKAKLTDHAVPPLPLVLPELFVVLRPLVDVDPEVEPELLELPHPLRDEGIVRLTGSGGAAAALLFVLPIRAAADLGIFATLVPVVVVAAAAASLSRCDRGLRSFRFVRRRSCRRLPLFLLLLRLLLEQGVRRPLPVDPFGEARVLLVPVRNQAVLRGVGFFGQEEKSEREERK